MVPVLPFGPLSLPTGPIMAILATIVGLEVAGRYAKRLDLATDDVWNTALIALAAGLIVARLWNVVQFWTIYQDEWMLVFSPRPSGFAPWPGLVGAFIAGYLYLLRRALDPLRVAAALAVGFIAASIVLSLSAFLTGSVLGVLSELPWAMPYYDELRHPAALYRAVGLGIVLAGLLRWSDPKRPGRTVLLASMGYSLVRLAADGFVADVPLLGEFRVNQIVFLSVALGCSLLLMRNSASFARPKAAEPDALQRSTD